MSFDLDTMCRNCGEGIRSPAKYCSAGCRDVQEPIFKEDAYPEFNQEKHVKNDPVNHPKHYTEHPSGIECIDVTRHMSFNIGNAVKYLWRFDLKNGIEDLKKAAWYIQDEINKREKGNK